LFKLFLQLTSKQVIFKQQILEISFLMYLPTGGDLARAVLYANINCVPRHIGQIKQPHTGVQRNEVYNKTKPG
jgi:hypothetical protein